MTDAAAPARPDRHIAKPLGHKEFVSYTITFWGTRGSIPTPGPATTRYGGNTPCVAVAGRADQLVILDAGSGIRPLGQKLAREVASGASLDILLSHTHWDHIQGLPFFQPLYARGNSVRIYGAPQAGVPLEKILGRQMDPMVFPVPLKALSADITISEVTDRPFEIDGFRVEVYRLRHPGTTLGYKLTPVSGGATVAYVTDNELGSGGSYEVGPDWRSGLVQFLDGVHLLIHDAMYPDQLLDSRGGWGHSSPTQAITLAAEAKVAHLLLFHHEPEHGDDELDRVLSEAQTYARRSAPRLTVDAAREGLSIKL
ncbi:MAG TPA: MBL fold metallo-hydrolase [Gemmatimonadales bacterium]|nr:MBL fold metallo-hydrolase [Gemmatimonadales bacterium]